MEYTVIIRSKILGLWVWIADWWFRNVDLNCKLIFGGCGFGLQAHYFWGRGFRLQADDFKVVGFDHRLVI